MSVYILLTCHLDEPLETKSTTPSLLSIDIENRPTETLSIQELRELFRRLQVF